MNRRRILTLLPVLLVMGLIFWFSSQSGTESGAQSGRVVTYVMERLHQKGLDDWNAIEAHLVSAVSRFLRHFGITDSAELERKVVKLLTLLLAKLGYEGSTGMMQRLVSFLIRKLGHFSEFGLLGITLMLFFGSGRTAPTSEGQKKGLFVPFVWSLLVGVAYACTDELHQRFVPDRGPSFRDVGIDSCGLLTGVLFMLVLLAIIRGRRCRKARRKKEKEEALNGFYAKYL